MIVLPLDTVDKLRKWIKIDVLSNFMSNDDPKKLGEDLGFSVLGERLTFNPSLEESSDDSMPKEISNATQSQLTNIFDDDENVSTGVMNWFKEAPKLPLKPASLDTIIPNSMVSEDKDEEFTIVREGEYDIDELSDEWRDEVAIDQQFHQLENSFVPAADTEKPAMDDFDEDDSGPSARIYDVVAGRFSTNPPAAANKDNMATLAPPALSHDVNSLAKYLDEDITLDLTPYQSNFWAFAESEYAENYRQAWKYYEKHKDTKGIKQPLCPPSIEKYLQRFIEASAKKKRENK